jgi:hypothetical protein
MQFGKVQEYLDDGRQVNPATQSKPTATDNPPPPRYQHFKCQYPGQKLLK